MDFALDAIKSEPINNQKSRKKAGYLSPKFVDGAQITGGGPQLKSNNSITVTEASTLTIETELPVNNNVNPIRKNKIRHDTV